MRWRYGFAELGTLALIGEVMSAHEKTCSLPLNGMPTASVRLGTDNPMVDEVLSRNGDCLLKVYEDVGARVSGSLGASGDVTVTSTAGFPSSGTIHIDAEIVLYTGLTSTTFTGCTRGAGGTSAATHLSGTPILPLQFIGEVMSMEEVASGDAVSVAITAAGTLQRLQKRLFGTPYPYAVQSFTDQPADQILTAIVNQANTNFDTGIRLGTLDALYKTTYGVESPASMKPIAEVLADMQASKVAYPVATPPTYTSQDTFTQAGGGTPGTDPNHTVGAIAGQKDSHGNTWTGNGDSRDFQEQIGATSLYRGWHNDNPYPRYAFLSGVSLGPVVVGVDFSINQVTVPVSMGVLARHNGLAPPNDQWVQAYADLLSHTVYIAKKIGGTITTIGSYQYVAPSAFTPFPDWYSLKLLIDDFGNFTVWVHGQGLPMDAPKIVGSDSDMATGEVLASGSIGVVDGCTAPPPDGYINRIYDNFYAAAYTGPQSFDFELQPLEPVPDTAGYPGSMPTIAKLNVRYQIGQVRQNAIFEYGTGGRTVKSYRRFIDRQGMVNIAYSLPPNFPESADIRSSTDWTSVNARGALQEVIPGDVADGQLRQALVDAHTQVRGTPRQLVTFEPSANTPLFGLDFLVGDFVTARAVVDGTVRFNGQFRVYGIELTVDDEGKETVVPTLTIE